MCFTSSARRARCGFSELSSLWTFSGKCFKEFTIFLVTFFFFSINMSFVFSCWSIFCIHTHWGPNPVFEIDIQDYAILYVTVGKKINKSGTEWKSVIDAGPPESILYTLTPFISRLMWASQLNCCQGTLEQGCPNRFLEGHCPAEFSSNPN